MRPWLAWTLWASVLAARPWPERTALLQTQPVSFTDSSGGTWRFTVHEQRLQGKWSSEVLKGDEIVATQIKDVELVDGALEIECMKERRGKKPFKPDKAYMAVQTEDLSAAQRVVDMFKSVGPAPDSSEKAKQKEGEEKDAADTSKREKEKEEEEAKQREKEEAEAKAKEKKAEEKRKAAEAKEKEEAEKLHEAQAKEKEEAEKVHEAEAKEKEAEEQKETAEAEAKKAEKEVKEAAGAGHTVRVAKIGGQEESKQGPKEGPKEGPKTEEDEKPTTAKEEGPKFGPPIPGSQTWGFTKRKKNTEACGQKQYCCQRGCKYNVDEDKCDECSIHHDMQDPPEKEIERYQAANRKFRIPRATDSYGLGARPCTKKNSIVCKDQEHKKVCCCNTGFIFSFETRECVADSSEEAGKEDPIPGSQKWGWTHKKGAADKCVGETSRYCCHRACKYEIDKDRCGRCVGYAENSPPVEKVLLDFRAKGSYVIPPGIDKPGWFRGKCSTPNAMKCQGTKECCCNQGLSWSFNSRTCVSPQQVQDEEKKEFQEVQAREHAEAEAEAHAGPPPSPTAEQHAQPAAPAGEQDTGPSTASKMLSMGKAAMKQGNGAAGRSCSLAVALLLVLGW